MILQACHSCERQYDVSHLQPGSRVRCVCEVLITVSSPKDLRVRAKRCTNCGGRVEEGEASCGYCGSKLNEPDLTSTLCPSCFHRVEDDANHCKACGVEIAPQALTALPDDRACPRCKAELAVRSLGEASVIECTQCQSLWVKRVDFERICKRAQETADIALEQDPSTLPIRSAEPERKVFYIACPTCGQQMLRKMFRYKDLPSRVVIDYCREHGVWFDRGELESIVSFVRSKANLDLPYSMDDSLGRKGRRSRGPSTIPIEHTSGVDGWDVLGTFLVADALGDVVGGILGGLFD